MNRHRLGLLIATAVSICLLLAVGRGYSGDARSSVSVHTGYYSGDYWYDPYYGSSCCRGGAIVVPPSGNRPLPGQRPPGGWPAAQLPSRPRPAPRPTPGSRAR